MAALTKKLVELQRSSPGKKLHLDFLQAFAEHGQNASPVEAVNFLSQLRKVREASAKKIKGVTQRQLLQVWANECADHQGWQLLRSRLFRKGKDGLEGVQSRDLSLAYNTLSHMNLSVEVAEVWPLIASRLQAGTMKDPRELMGVWTVAPEEHMQSLDVPLARALGAAADKLAIPQLLSCIARAGTRPGSEAVRWSAGELGRRLSDLASEDLAAIVAHLDTRPPAGAIGEFDGLVAKAKAELVSRDGALEAHHLVRLLGSIKRRDDELWIMVRKQLLTRKNLSAPQILEVCRLLHSFPDGAKSEASVFGFVAKQLRTHLSTRADPPLVTLVARNLDVLICDYDTCQDLLNAAVRLRQDLYPGALWKLFLCASDVDLVGRHPALQNRLQKIGDVLEQHLIGEMTLSEMTGIVVAMRRNNTVLKKSASQMTKRFMEVLRTVEEQASGAAAPEVPGEAAKSIVGSAEGTGKNWLAEVQRLLLGYWTQLRILGLDEPQLLEAVRSMGVVADGCQLDAKALADVVGALAAAPSEDAEAGAIRESLVALVVAKVPSLSQRTLLEIADITASDAVRGAVVSEVNRRLSGGTSAGVVTSVSSLRRGEDFDNLATFLLRWPAWSSVAPPLEGDVDGGEPSGPSGPLVARAQELVAGSLPRIMEKEPSEAARRLSDALRVLMANSPGSDASLASLRQSLHLLSRMEARGQIEPPKAPLAADLAFGFCVLYRGALPFDVSARLWRLVGSAFAGSAAGGGSSSSSSGGGSGSVGGSRGSATGHASGALAAAVDVAVGAGRASELWVFGHTVRYLSSPSVLAALRLMPQAPVLEACLARFEHKPAKLHFHLLQDGDAAAAALSKLREFLGPELAEDAEAK